MFSLPVDQEEKSREEKKERGEQRGGFAIR
jgi:hypothetical protein